MRLAAEGGEEEDAPILRSGESAPRAGARWGRGAQCMVLLLLLAVAAAMLLLTWPPAAAPTAAVTLAPSVAVGEDDDDVDDDYNDALFELDFNATSQASLDCERISERERTLGTLEHALKWANCGLGVNASESLALHRPWRVVLLGPLWEDKVLQQSGCLVGHGRCPFSPKCVIAHSNSISGDTVAEANVVVLFQKDAKRIINQLHGHPAAGNKPYRVLYWREARWPSVYGVQRAWFDFEMGIRDTSGIFNPGFHYPPSQMQLGIVPGVGQLPFVAFENRTGFALSIISDCRAESQRLVYLERMLGILGRDRVHQYGKCGDMELPHKPVVNAAVVIARYKFFMAFENRIMQGYVTEKLTQVLGFNVVPVYYGDPAAPNVRLTCGFDLTPAHADYKDAQLHSRERLCHPGGAGRVSLVFGRAPGGVHEIPRLAPLARRVYRRLPRRRALPSLASRPCR